MSESGIYIRVDKNNVLLEDLDLINRNEWLNGLDKAGLIRTINILCKALHESNEKIKTYEDPNDLTLMFMYCDEKAKDKIKELKKQLHEASIKTQEMIEQDIECPSNCSKLKELKKQIEEERDKVREYSYKLCNFRCEETYENQQKEFIEYLEYQVKLQEEINDIHLATGFEEILSKYKEIIGGKDE